MKFWLLNNEENVNKTILNVVIFKQVGSIF